MATKKVSVFLTLAALLIYILLSGFYFKNQNNVVGITHVFDIDHISGIRVINTKKKHEGEIDDQQLSQLLSEQQVYKVCCFVQKL